MNTPPARYQFVRDRTTWDAAIAGLWADADGDLLLMRAPGLPGNTPIALPGPYDPGPSGVAAGPCGAVFVAETDADRVIFEDGLCNARANLDGMRAPCGLAVIGDRLWIAHSGAGRLRRLAFPTLELDLEIAAGLQRPTDVAGDSAQRLYALDRGAKAVRRFLPPDRPDTAYDAKLAAAAKIAAPLFLAIGPADRLYLSDGSTDSLYVFADDGGVLPDIPAPPGGWRPGALAASQTSLYVADSASGVIHILTLEGAYLGALPGFVGPVAAMATDPATGDLMIKTGLDDALLRCAAEGAYLAQGRIVAGPFDAGEKLEWRRAACLADAPSGASVLFEVAQLATAAPPPGPAEWVAAPAPDMLLATALPPGPPPTLRRFLWLRATLTTRNPQISPRLRNLRAQTPGEDYRDYLPALYQRADEPGGFVDRLLALAQTELAAVEEAIDAAPLAFAPDFAPVSWLAWIAQWVGLDLPAVATDSQRRRLIERAATLYRLRGTPAGIAEFVEIYTGVRPAIVENFSTRGLWILDVCGALGFDTALPQSDPVGLVVPDPDNPLAQPAGGCATPVGSAVVGESGPLPIEDLGAPLFSRSAHRFTVYMPAYRATQIALVAEVRRIVEAEKPAHTGYDLCLVEADMRVGLQACVGVDTIVGGPPAPMRLNESVLGLRGVLPPPVGNVARVGEGARIGRDSQLG